MSSPDHQLSNRPLMPLIRIGLSIGLLMSVILGLTSCSEGSPVEPTTELVVVRGYLYAGEPVTDIQLTKTISLSSVDSTAPPVNDASVDLIKEGRTYRLVLTPGDSGYYHYPGNDLEVKEGDRFDINVRYGGRTATATTSVPPPPDSVTLSSETLVIPATTDFGFFRPDTNRLVIQWSNPTGSLYYVVVENIETNPEPIVIGIGPLERARGRFISPPTSSNSYMINILSLTHYGRHRVKVYRINEEYADLYRSRQQDSRDLNEPLTNITNGLGVFSAFNSVSAYFAVVK
ncbi:MAG: DUF4249 family protein [Deltaproteobacteria bacterium]|nr:DUF4249 family protein [Deltaproteobacteria bacterium]